MMGGKARVSAVFLLALAIWVGGVWGDDADRRATSARTSATKNKVGVGTETDVRGVDESRVAGQGEAVWARPQEVFREVEKGLRYGTPVPFERYLGKGKIKLDFGEGGPRGGFFNKGQAYYLISDYFKRAPTVKVRLLRVAEVSERANQPYALLERTCRDKNGSVREELVFVLLAHESEGWMITELRVLAAR
jgi:hypothetical protein